MRLLICIGVAYIAPLSKSIMDIVVSRLVSSVVTHLHHNYHQQKNEEKTKLVIVR
jgi:hypothetical protein